MYGDFEEPTHEWRDGLVSKFLREASLDRSEIRKWLIFDGPVDSTWAENLNSVLDDNSKLNVANNQIIHLKNEINLIFEVEDLRTASPSTVSRCGIVYINEDKLNWRSYVLSWVNKRF